MDDKRWKGLRLESAAMEPGGSQNCRSSRAPADCKIQGVVFEPCGVLYDDSAWRLWLWQLTCRMGLSSHYAPFFRVWDCEFQEAVWSGQLDMWTALGRFLRSAGMPQPGVDEVIAASRAKFRRFNQDTRPFPDVRRTVWSLYASGIQIMVMPHHPLGAKKTHERLDQIGIGKLVTRVLSHPDEGGPVKLIEWQRGSLAALPGPAGNWAFVGRQQAGLKLARRMGLLTVAFNHDADAVADVYIEQFAELAPLLDCQTPSGTGDSPAKAA